MSLSRRTFLAASGMVAAGAAATQVYAAESTQQQTIIVGACGISCSMCSAMAKGTCKGCGKGTDKNAAASKCAIRQCAAMKKLDYCCKCPGFTKCDKLKKAFAEDHQKKIATKNEK